MKDDKFYEAVRLSLGPFADKPTPELLEPLCDKDEETRHIAACALHLRGERVAFDRGIELTRDDRAYVRDSAAFLLGQLGYRDDYPFSKESAPVLEGLLNNDPSNNVRAGAAAALGHLYAESALDSLVQAVDDPDAEIRYCVASALFAMASPELAPVIEKIRNDPDGDVADWGEMGMEVLYMQKFESETVENLGSLLADADLDIAARKAATEILAERDEAVAWKQARAFRKSESAALRLNAPLLSNWLGRRKGAPLRAEVIGMLTDMLGNDPEARVRDQTAVVLAEFMGDEVLDSLIAAAADPDWRVRSSVAFALSRHGEPDRVPPLKELCNDPDERVARHAAERLEWMQGILRARTDD